MQAAILAGGLGTRLRPLTQRFPKAMIPVNGRPFLEYEIDLLKNCGIRDFVFCVGYLGEQIEKHFGDGSVFGVRVRYSRDGKELMGPIGALKMAQSMLHNEFFVTYGDAYLRLDYRAMMSALMQQKALGMMAVYRNEGRYGRSDVVVMGGHVVEYDKREDKPGMAWINFGVSALRKVALEGVREGEPRDEESFYGGLIRKRQLLAFEVKDRFYEIGNPKGLAEFSRFAKAQGLVPGGRSA